MGAGCSKSAKGVHSLFLVPLPSVLCIIEDEEPKCASEYVIWKLDKSGGLEVVEVFVCKQELPVSSPPFIRQAVASQQVRRRPS